MIDEKFVVVFRFNILQSSINSENIWMNRSDYVSLSKNSGHSQVTINSSQWYNIIMYESLMSTSSDLKAHGSYRYIIVNASGQQRHNLVMRPHFLCVFRQKSSIRERERATERQISNHQINGTVTNRDFKSMEEISRFFTLST